MPKVNLALGLLTVLAVSTMISACATGGGGGNVKGNDNGSEPINEQEKYEYQKAIVRCYKTGGTRVVKIMGELRCY